MKLYVGAIGYLMLAMVCTYMYYRDSPKKAHDKAITLILTIGELGVLGFIVASIIGG